MGIFKDGFLWGTATAAHQVEGNNYANDWWEWENRVPSHCVEPSLDACDQYHLYKDDIALMAALGFNMYRFSIEWSRIEPENGCYSKAEINHYRNVLLCLVEHGIVPCVTLHHFSSPRWISSSGGWTQQATVDAFLRYAELVTKELREHIPMICTINEPNIVAFMAYRMGMFPPGEQSSNARRQATDNFILAHQKSVETIKSIDDSIQVGLALSMTDYQPLEGAEARAKKIAEIMEDVYLSQLGPENDFIGVQTYSRDRTPVSGISSPEPGMPTTEMGYEIYPEALQATITKAAKMTNLRVLVTENGIAPKDDDDSIRVKFIDEALKGVQKCIESGIDVLGYTYWSFLDNFEWNLGYKPRFGLVKVDRKTMRRSVKPSAIHLGQIARNNSI